MNGDRRQDIGLKMVYGLLCTIITILLMLFFNKTYGLAETAQKLSNENKKDIAVMQQCIKAIDLNLVKIDFKLDTLLEKRK